MDDLKLNSPDEVVSAVRDIAGKLGVLATKQGELEGAIRESLADSSTHMAQVDQGHLGAFQRADGSLRLTREHIDREVPIGNGQVRKTTVLAPGVLDLADADDIELTDRERNSIRRFSRALHRLSLARKIGTVFPHELVNDMETQAHNAPLSLRDAFRKGAKLASDQLRRSVRMDGLLSDTPFSTAHTTSTNPGYDFIGDLVLPGMIDVSAREAGLYDLVIPSGNRFGGLHPTAKVKILTLTSFGGPAQLPRIKSATGEEWPLTDVDTNVPDVTGEGMLFATMADQLDIQDPRNAVATVEMLIRAGQLSRLATNDGILIHGEKETAASSHTYAAAGLQQLSWDGRDSDRSGQSVDPFLVADGMYTWANDRSKAVDLVSALSGLSAATDAFSSRANFVSVHNHMLGLLDSQYQDGAAAFVGRRTVRKLNYLNTTADAPRIFIPATPEQRAANPWFAGVMYDGTPVFQHSYITSGFNSSGVPASGGALDVLIYGNMAPVLWVSGPNDGEVVIKASDRSDALRVAVRVNGVPWLPLDTSTHAMAVGYNVDAT